MKILKEILISIILSILISACICIGALGLIVAVGLLILIPSPVMIPIVLFLGAYIFVCTWILFFLLRFLFSNPNSLTFYLTCFLTFLMVSGFAYLQINYPSNNDKINLFARITDKYYYHYTDYATAKNINYTNIAIDGSSNSDYPKEAVLILLNIPDVKSVFSNGYGCNPQSNFYDRNNCIKKYKVKKYQLIPWPECSNSEKQKTFSLKEFGIFDRCMQITEDVERPSELTIIDFSSRRKWGFRFAIAVYMQNNREIIEISRWEDEKGSGEAYLVNKEKYLSQIFNTSFSYSISIPTSQDDYIKRVINAWQYRELWGHEKPKTQISIIMSGLEDVLKRECNSKGASEINCSPLTPITRKFIIEKISPLCRLSDNTPDKDCYKNLILRASNLEKSSNEEIKQFWQNMLCLECKKSPSAEFE